MKLDVLVAEIGSTTTLVSGFIGVHTDSPVFLGQGQAATTVREGDVGLGLRRAMSDLGRVLRVPEVACEEMLATSSAAGGLRMTVHGLVYDMTVKAAREAALGAGAILHLATAGRLRGNDLERIRQICPNLILLAGGVDYGERETALENAERIRDLALPIPVVYAGNVQNQDEIRAMFSEQPERLYLVDNVYPKIDQLNVEPTRRIIQQAFMDHIVQAPGMERIREWVNGPIIPTPGAVMEAARLLYDAIGDLMVLDVGGATTDVHSVTAGSEEIARISVSPEPLAKRTVEGDLGVYINRYHIVEQIGKETFAAEWGEGFEQLLERLPAIPQTDEDVRLVERLSREAVVRATERHAGTIRYVYGPSGRNTLAEGKDLTMVRTIIGTGGALTQLPGRVELLKRLALHNHTGLLLFPGKDARILIDQQYTMASLGVLSMRYPKAALRLLEQSLGLREA